MQLKKHWLKCIVASVVIAGIVLCVLPAVNASAFERAFDGDKSMTIWQAFDRRYVLFQVLSPILHCLLLVVLPYVAWHPTRAWLATSFVDGRRRNRIVSSRWLAAVSWIAVLLVVRLALKLFLQSDADPPWAFVGPVALTMCRYLAFAHLPPRGPHAAV